jgi:hypothetical protein
VFGKMLLMTLKRSGRRGLVEVREKEIVVFNGTEMGKQIGNVLYVVAMIAIIVGVDFTFFRNQFWERLTVNIGIVLVFAAFYWRFLKHS